MIHDGNGCPQKIWMKLCEQARAAKERRIGGRYESVPTMAKIQQWKTNLGRGTKKSTAGGSPAGSPTSGQGVAPYGSPRESFDCVADLRNYAYSIQLPQLLSEMNRGEM